MHNKYPTIYNPDVESAKPRHSKTANTYHRKTMETTGNESKASDDYNVRINDINTNNFLKKIKSMSRTHTKITVRSLNPPKIKTDVQNVDPLNILTKSDQEMSRFEKKDYDKSKILFSKPIDYSEMIEKQQVQNIK